MTPYQNKLKDAIIQTGKTVENNKHQPKPTMLKIARLMFKFLRAIVSGDLRKQAKAARELTAVLVKWQVEEL